MHLLMQQMRNEQNQTSQALQQEIRETQKMINSLSKEEHVQIPLVAPSITPSHPVHTLHTPQPAQMRVTTSFTPAAHGAAVSSEEQAQALQDEHERNLDRMRQLREEKEESRLRMLRMKRIREEREEILSTSIPYFTHNTHRSRFVTPSLIDTTVLDHNINPIILTLV
ncbi:hypothetical protein BLNAU_8960 [Blattamonas nauphoetae]|uniref:Uncharacterized protein n=1 Tax=Blattamonas nauphoetae TaxID=2049346 RepID=A0ABQ9XWZ0_9EUKA|nr:hypothetical protein BLNAU_8960 [Blattamonas nauphoetae]